MASVFTRIIRGELPGRFVWMDERCAAFLTINPISPGHTLVVPRDEIDHWIDIPPDLWAHLNRVSATIGSALQRAFRPVKVALLIVGDEVPHAHIHLVPFDRSSQLSFANADPDPDPAVLDADAERIRVALREAGHAEADVVPGS